MFLGLRLSQPLPVRAGLLMVMSGIIAALLSVGVTSTAFAQASGKGADKGADKSADKGAATDESPQATPRQLDAKLLIGDSVDNPDSPQYQKVTEAIDKFRKMRWKEARDLLAEARTAHRQLPPPEVILAKLFIVFKQPQLAFQQLEEAVRNHPKDPEPYLMFAEASLAERHITGAESLYKDADELVKAFTENPKRKAGFEKRVLHGQAAVAESRQQWKTAEALLRQLIKLDPENANAQFRLGAVLFQQAGPNDNDKLSEAYKAFTAAWKAEAQLPTPDVAMGRLFEQAAQQALNANENAKYKNYRDQATKSFERATASKYNPDLTTLLAAATWALQTSQFKLAQQYANDALKKDPESLNAKFTSAVIARFSGNLATAEKLLQEAWNQAPADFAVSNQLALVLAESNTDSNKKRALDLAQTNARLNQNNAEAISTYGWVLYKLGYKKEAAQVLQNVVNARAVSPDSAYYVAQILADQDSNIQAVQVLEDALDQPQPFANRGKATALLAELKKEIESGATSESKDGKSGSTSPVSDKAGSRGAKSTTKGAK